MAENGYAPVEKSSNPAVEMIVRSNIGGVVDCTSSLAVGLPADEQSTELSLVPTSESARNLIAQKSP